jgi:hypothetical protein
MPSKHDQARPRLLTVALAGCVRACSPNFAPYPIGRTRETIMNTELVTAVENAAKIIIEQNPSYTPEQAQALAISVMKSAGVNFDAPAKAPPPATRPAAPRLDAAALANMSPAERSAAWREQEKNLLGWVDVVSSYEPPINEAAEAARARLVEMRALSDAATDMERAQRALDRERLMQIVLAQGGN